MIIMLFGQLWLVLAYLAALRLCWAKQAHSACRCCTYWWTGLVLRAVVTAVRDVSFKPIHPLSGIYGGVFRCRLCYSLCMTKPSCNEAHVGGKEYRKFSNSKTGASLWAHLATLHY